MDVVTERRKDILSVQVNGRVDGSNASEFEQAIRSAMDKSDRGVMLDFEQLVYISSAGLRAVLLIAKTLRSRDAKFALCSLSEQIRGVFEISGFDKIISIYPSRAEALSFLEG